MNSVGGLLPGNDDGWPGLGTSASDVGICPAAYGPSAAVPPGMNWPGTICPDPLLTETPVSPRIQSSVPLGSGTLTPTSRPTDLEAFSYCDRTGAGVALAGDAVASGGELVTQARDAVSPSTATTLKARNALTCRQIRSSPPQNPPWRAAVDL